MLMSVSFAVISLSLVKTTVHLSSHSCPIEIKDALWRLGSTVALRAAVDNLGERGRVPCSDGTRVLLSGNVTFTPLCGRVFARQCLSSSLQYVCEAPLSAFASTTVLEATENKFVLTFSLL